MSNRTSMESKHDSTFPTAPPELIRVSMSNRTSMESKPGVFLNNRLTLMSLNV